VQQQQQQVGMPEDLSDKDATNTTEPATSLNLQATAATPVDQLTAA
jgi:hypothetical protein